MGWMASEVILERKQHSQRRSRKKMLLGTKLKVWRARGMGLKQPLEYGWGTRHSERQREIHVENLRILTFRPSYLNFML